MNSRFINLTKSIGVSFNFVCTCFRKILILFQTMVHKQVPGHNCMNNVADTDANQHAAPSFPSHPSLRPISKEGQLRMSRKPSKHIKKAIVDRRGSDLENGRYRVHNRACLEGCSENWNFL